MKTVVLTFIFIFYGTNTLLKAQNIEGPKFPAEFLNKLAVVDGSVYYWNYTFYRKEIEFKVLKYNAETLSLEGTPKNLKIKIVGKFKGIDQQVQVHYLNKKFYFFYYVYHGTLKNCVTIYSEDFTKEKYLILGDVLITAYDINFMAALSPDKKTALIYNKYYCNKDQVIERNDSYCDEHQLLFFDLINDTVRKTKFIPNKMNGFLLKCSQFKLDNEDNISCIASIAQEKSKKNLIEATSTATLKNHEQNLKINELKIGETKKISSYLTQLKSGDVVYIGMIDSKVIFRHIPIDKTQKEFESSFSNRDFMKAGVDTEMIFNVSGCESGYYLALINKHETLSAAFINKNGELIWHKTFPTIEKAFQNYSIVYQKPVAFTFNDKLYIAFLENKPYEKTKNNLKAAEDANYIIESDNKLINTTLLSIDAIGNMKKEVIHDNELILGQPSKEILLSDKGYFILPLGGTYKSQLKKIYLK